MGCKTKGFLLLLQLKEVFRRELEKAEQEVRRSSGIISDYKQVHTIRSCFVLYKRYILIKTAAMIHGCWRSFFGSDLLSADKPSGEAAGLPQRRVGFTEGENSSTVILPSFIAPQTHVVLRLEQHVVGSLFFFYSPFPKKSFRCLSFSWGFLYNSGWLSSFLFSTFAECSEDVPALSTRHRFRRTRRHSSGLSSYGGPRDDRIRPAWGQWEPQKSRAEEGWRGEGVSESSDQGAGAGAGPDQTSDGGGQVQDSGESRPTFRRRTFKNTFWESKCATTRSKHCRESWFDTLTSTKK